MKDAKKFTLISPDDGYEIYAKKGTLAGKDKDRHTRNTQIRLVPCGPHWSVDTGVDGYTLARMEEDGNGVDVWLDGEHIRLDYCQWAYLKYLMQAHEKIDPPWWEEPEWFVSEIEK